MTESVTCIASWIVLNGAPTITHTSANCALNETEFSFLRGGYCEITLTLSAIRATPNCLSCSWLASSQVLKSLCHRHWSGVSVGCQCGGSWRAMWLSSSPHWASTQGFTSEKSTLLPQLLVLLFSCSFSSGGFSLLLLESTQFLPFLKK